MEDTYVTPNTTSPYLPSGTTHLIQTQSHRQFHTCYIQSFYQVVYSEISLMYQQTPTSFHPNLTTKEKLALQNLSENLYIIIKPADKGGRIVIQDQEDYLQEAKRLLSDKNTYIRLRFDPQPLFSEEAHALVKPPLTDEIINKTEASFLKKQFICTQL